MNRVLVFVFITMCLSGLAQPNTTHIIGGEVGTRPYFKDDQEGTAYKFELGFNYILRYRLLALKTEIASAPLTDYGFINKGNIQLGIFTNPKRNVSYYFFYGAEVHGPTREKYVSTDWSMNTWRYTTQLNATLCTGFLFYPKRGKNFLIGVEISISKLVLDDYYKPQMSVHSSHQFFYYPINLGFSFNYILKSKNASEK